MPVTVFDIKGLPGHRREHIEAAVVAGGKHTKAPHEAWIAADPFKGGFRVLITGPNGFERTVTFAIDDDPAVIAERVRETWMDRRRDVFSQAWPGARCAPVSRLTVPDRGSHQSPWSAN